MFDEKNHHIENDKTNDDDDDDDETFFDFCRRDGETASPFGGGALFIGLCGGKSESNKRKD